MNRSLTNCSRTLQIVTLTILGLFSSVAEAKAAGTNAHTCCVGIPMSSCGCCTGLKTPATNTAGQTQTVMALHHNDSDSFCQCSAQTPGSPSSNKTLQLIRIDREGQPTFLISPIRSQTAADRVSFTRLENCSGLTKHPLYVCICRLTI